MLQQPQQAPAPAAVEQSTDGVSEETLSLQQTLDGVVGA